MNRAPSPCRNGGSATARPSWMRWSRKAWRKPGPGRHRPLAGCRPRAAARPGQFIPDAHRGRRRRGLAQARADHARPARSHQALQRLHRPDPGALRSRHLRRGALRQRGRGRSRRAARFPAGLGAPRAGRQHRHRRHPLGRAGRKGRADGEAGRAVAPGRARRAAPLRAGFGLAERGAGRRSRRRQPGSLAARAVRRMAVHPPRAGRAAGPHARPGAARPGLRRADAAGAGAGARAVGSAGLAPGHPGGGNGGASRCRRCRTGHRAALFPD